MRNRQNALQRATVARTAELVVSLRDAPERVLDVGCGTGDLLRLLAERFPAATELAGVDPAPELIRIAEAQADDERLWFASGVGAENLPFGAGTFDIVVATNSVRHWSDRRVGLLECARVLKPAGHLVMVDSVATLPTPALLLGGRGKPRTKRGATRLLESAGFVSIEWRDLHRPFVKAAVCRT